MPFPTSLFIQYAVRVTTPSIDQFHQVMEVRSHTFRRITSGSLNKFFYTSEPIPHNNALLPIPLNELEDDPMAVQFYIKELLLPLIGIAACGTVAGEIASCISQITTGDREMSLHIVAVVNTIQLLWMIPTNSERNSPWKVRMERLEANDVGDHDLGDCSICLNEFNGKENQVVKMACGHVYHKPCILKWLRNHHSCPLCRSPLALETKGEE